MGSSLVDLFGTIENRNFDRKNLRFPIDSNFKSKIEFTPFKVLPAKFKFKGSTPTEESNAFAGEFGGPTGETGLTPIRIKKRPSLGVFDKNSSQKKKKGLFSKKNDNSTQNKSEKAIKIIESLEKNSIQILVNQSNYNTSIDRLISIFRKKKHRLVFIRNQVREWGQEVKGLAYERQKLVPTLANFNLILSEALFKSAESEYANNIVNLSGRLERFKNEMDKFEAYVNNLESIAGKQAKGLVYLIKEGQEKNYEKKYKKDLENYQSILKEIPKMIESV